MAFCKTYPNLIPVDRNPSDHITLRYAKQTPIPPWGLSLKRLLAFVASYGAAENKGQLKLDHP